MAERTCPICSAPVAGRSKTCSPECARKRRNLQALEFRRVYQARTGEPYTRQYREQRNTKHRDYIAGYRERTGVETRCAYCDKLYLARSDGVRQFCSMSCRSRFRGHPASKIRVMDCGGGCGRLATLRSGRTWRCEACQLPATTTNPRFQAGRCRRCDAYFVMLYNNNPCHYCSGGCQRRDHKSTRRARKREAFVEPVYRARIFERDGWRCQICKKKVRRDAVPPHPLAPVLDHITPLADGGTHEPANVQCAHHRCNCVKSAGAANDQLRLIG